MIISDLLAHCNVQAPADWLTEFIVHALKEPGMTRVCSAPLYGL